MKLISFDIQADFAFFRKPETNNMINLSYNIIHKPAILGLLGAILGLSGYQEKGKWPEYYQKLKNLKVGVAPLQHEKGNFAKTNIKYTNTIGYANKGSNFLTEELTLINPAYRVYLLLDENDALQAHLLSSIQKGEAVYVPYLGKNEFTAWWNPSSYKSYTFDKIEIAANQSVKIVTVFEKEIKIHGQIEAPFPDFFQENINFDETPFIYFERLPKGFDEVLMQYELAEFAFSTYDIKNAHNLDNLYALKEINAYAQLF